MTKIKYKLTKPQSEIISCTAKKIVVCAGRRFGKTWLAGARILKKGSERGTTRKKTWFISPTNNQNKENMWRDWIGKYIPDQYINEKHEKEMYMVFNPTLNELYLKSADDPDHLRGSGVDFVVFDEYRDMRLDTYDIVSPVMSDKDRDNELLVISTPNGYDHFYDLAMKAKREQEAGNKNWAFFQYTTEEGGNVSQEELDERRRTMSPKMYAQEYLASFETLTNRIYESFTEGINTGLHVEKFIASTPLPEEILVGIDFNVNPMTAAIAFSVKDPYLGEKLYFFDEIVENNSNTQSLSDILKKRFPGKKITVYPDPTGKRKQTSSTVGQSDFDILANNGFKVRAPHAPYQTRDKWNTVNSSFLNAFQESRVFISSRKCPQLTKAFVGYSYNEKGEANKTTGLDHISDAAAYLICFRMPFLQKKRIYIPKVFGIR